MTTYTAIESAAYDRANESAVNQRSFELMSEINNLKDLWRKGLIHRADYITFTEDLINVALMRKEINQRAYEILESIAGLDF